MFQPSTQTEHQRDINGDSGYSDTWYSPHQQLRVRRKWETPGNAMNHPKTNAYPKHYDISNHEISPGTISPKPWHTVFTTQVDIPILTTCDKPKYRFQVIEDWLPCRFPHLWDWLGLHPAWLRYSWFLEYSNRPVDVQRFVPPEDIYHEIHGRICKHHDFKMSDWKVFNATCNALHYEPQHLKKDKGLGEPVAFTPVLDFCRCRHGEWLGVTQKITLLQWMEGFIMFFRYALIVITRLFGAMLEKMEPPYDNKEPMRLQPSSI